MTSPFSFAEFIGGPLDGRQYDRRSDGFPDKLQIEVDGIVYGYVARLDRYCGVCYRFVGALAVVAIT
jgi:hypothetical protein